jgi:hypothetical protein
VATGVRVGGKPVGVAEGIAVGADGSDVGVGPQAGAAIMHRIRIQVMIRCLFIAFHLLTRRVRLMDRKRLTSYIFTAEHAESAEKFWLILSGLCVLGGEILTHL